MDYTESSPAAASETVVNIDVNSELLEGYMEMCVSYRCKECLYTSTDQKTFYEHCLGHLLKDSTSNQTHIYVCSSCLKAFNSLEETKRHLKDDHKDGVDVSETPTNFAVAVEGTETEVIVKKRGKYKVREKEKLLCPRRNCLVRFQKEADLETHSKCHLDSDIFSCPHCTLLFHTWPNCALHLDRAHGIDCGLLTCAICKVYKTWAPLKLENHMRIHGDLRAFACKTCGKAFKQASQLRNHAIIHEDNDAQLNWNKSKQCTMCFKMYSDAKTLKKHKDEVHSKLRPFVCNVCGHASARKSMLTLHQRQHTGHKPLACTNCDFKTADHNSLRRHMMRHNGVRQYQCPSCPFSTVLSSSFKRHVRQLHSHLKIIFNCSRCTYKTVSQDNYVRHVSDHLTGLIKDSGHSQNENNGKLADDFSAWVTPTEETTVEIQRAELRSEDQLEHILFATDNITHHPCIGCLHEMVKTKGLYTCGCLSWRFRNSASMNTKEFFKSASVTLSVSTQTPIGLV